MHSQLWLQQHKCAALSWERKLQQLRLCFRRCMYEPRGDINARYVTNKDYFEPWFMQSNKNVRRWPHSGRLQRVASCPSQTLMHQKLKTWWFRSISPVVRLLSLCSLALWLLTSWPLNFRWKRWRALLCGKAHQPIYFDRKLCGFYVDGIFMIVLYYSLMESVLTRPFLSLCRSLNLKSQKQAVRYS